MDTRLMCPHQHMEHPNPPLSGITEAERNGNKLIIIDVPNNTGDTNGIMLNLSVYEKIYNLIII